MQYLTKENITRIMLEAQPNLRDHLMLVLSFQHGLRASEVAALRIGDVLEGHIQVARVKGSLLTRQPLIGSQNPLFDEPTLLAKWVASRPGGSDFLFPSRKGGKLRPDSLGKIAVRYMEMANVPYNLAHHHSLKHACCSLQARAGVKIEYIAQFVGHKDIKNTRIYLNISDEEATAKAFETFKKLLEA